MRATRPSLSTLALTILTLSALSAPAAAEPPGPCGWTIEVDPPTVAVPLDRPAVFTARHWNFWNCEPGIAPMTIAVRDGQDAAVPGDWQHDSVRDLMRWTPADGWPAAGRYTMRLDYVFDGDPGFDLPPGTPQTTELELIVGEPFVREGFAIDITALAVTGEDEQRIDCCDDGETCWVEQCDVRLRADIDWTVLGPAGAPWPPTVWLEGIVEEAPTPDAEPRLRWSGRGAERPFALRLDALPTCLRVRLDLLPGSDALVSSPWRCIEAYAPIGPPCMEEMPSACGDPPPDADAGPGGDAGPETDPDAGLTDGSDGGASGADGGASGADGAAEAHRRGRDGCSVTAPGSRGDAPWGGLVFGALLLAALLLAATRRGRGQPANGGCHSGPPV